jgi:catechol 2,3-dioxygenase-like lactoylglutathione lyase family enzyme
MEMLKDAIAHATLPAADLERAKGFWAKLGLSPTNESPGGVDYVLGGGTGFSVYPTPNPTRGGHTQLGLRVDHVESEVADLRAKGVVFEEYDMPGLKTENGIATLEGVQKAAWFKDDDGNIIGVFERS